VSDKDKIENKPRVVYIGELTENVSKEIILELMRFDMVSNEPIRVVVNSCGGYTSEMFAIYDAMRICDSPILTIGIGTVMSAGVILLAAGENGGRTISASSTVMIHEVSSAS